MIGCWHGCKYVVWSHSLSMLVSRMWAFAYPNTGQCGKVRSHMIDIPTLNKKQ